MLIDVMMQSNSIGGILNCLFVVSVYNIPILITYAQISRLALKLYYTYPFMIDQLFTVLA